MMSKAPYTMVSATDFFPSYMMEFMNFVTTTSPNFGSGMISRFSALWRRDMRDSDFPVSSSPASGRGSRWNLAADPRVKPADDAPRASLRPLRAVLRTTLLAILHALRVEDTAEDVVANAREVLHAAAADHHHGMLLEIVALARDVADHLESVRQANLGDLAQRGVRLLRRRGVDARAHAALLRAGFQRGDLVPALLGCPRLADQLADRRHPVPSSMPPEWRCLTSIERCAVSPAQTLNELAQ